jgi:hypothetical protein
MDHNHDTASADPLLLSFTDHGDIEDYSDKHKAPTRLRSTNWFVGLCRPIVVTALLCISLASIVLNVYLFSALSHQAHTRAGKAPIDPPSSLQGKSSYTGLSLDTPSIHYHHTDYWSKNETLADELWEGIDTNPMVVALTDDFADSHGLPRSDRFPWDESKGRYFVKVFHQLHCLVSTFTNTLVLNN